MLSANIKRVLRSLKISYVRQTATHGNLASPQQPPSNGDAEPANDLAKIVQLPAYTEAQQQKILQAINEKSAEQLLSYDITKTRANKLQNWKTRNGQMQQLSDILYVEGFGLKVATKFYKSLLEPPIAAAEQRKKAAPFVTPALEETQRQRIKSSVAVRIGVASVSWARVELPEHAALPCSLTHWQHHELNDKKLHLAELAQRCLYVAHQIPPADCYLMENPQMAQASSNPGSIDQQNVNIQRAQMISMLSFGLMARAEPGDRKKTNLFYMRRFLTARLFNHLVGTERVSSEETILALMRTFYNLDDYEEPSQGLEERANLRGQLQFPSHLRLMFSQAERHQRELLGQACLLNLAFVRLVLLQDEASIATVSRGGKKLTSADAELE